MSGGFLRRWSERKAATREAEAARPEPTDDTLVQGAAATGAALPHEDAALTRGPQRSGSDSDSEQSAPSLSPSEIDARLADLPLLDDIGPETDIRPFLQDFVPAALRKAAMRRAWSADPIISTHLDVARDYAWEFNSGDLPVGFSRSLDQHSLQRSLDALGKIGEEPLKKVFPVKEEVQAEAGSVAAAQTEDATQNAAGTSAEGEPMVPQGEDLAAPAAVETEGATAPALPTADAEPAAPQRGLVLRPKHGTALPD